MSESSKSKSGPVILSEGFAAQEGIPDHLIVLLVKILDMTVESCISVVSAAEQLHSYIDNILNGDNEAIAAGAFDSQTLRYATVPALLALIAFLATR